MSRIKNLMINDKIVDVEFPDSNGFFISLAYLSREKLLKIRNRSLVVKFNKRTRQRDEEVDNDKFLEEYSREVIRGWRGLTLRELARIMPIETTGANMDEVISYSEEDALELLRNAPSFDQFITDCMNDFEIFERDKNAAQEKN
jgi:hypothetical protein